MEKRKDLSPNKRLEKECKDCEVWRAQREEGMEDQSNSKVAPQICFPAEALDQVQERLYEHDA